MNKEYTDNLTQGCNWIYLIDVDFILMPVKSKYVGTNVFMMESYSCWNMCVYMIDYIIENISCQLSRKLCALMIFR